MNSPLVSFGRRISLSADSRPGDIALVFCSRDGTERSVTWRELDLASNRLARLFESRGVGAGRMVVIALPNSVDHVVATIAVWKAGGCVLPMPAALPPRERDPLLALAEPAVVVADWTDVEGVLGSGEIASGGGFGSEPLEDRIPDPGVAVGSGGSTGRSKIIVDPNPCARPLDGFLDEIAPWTGMRASQTQLVSGPLYHNGPFMLGYYGLLSCQRLVLMEKFDAGRALEILERHRVGFTFVVATSMRRMLQADNFAWCDLSSLESLYHSGAPCPQWVKRAWIERLGPKRIHEAYGSAEGSGGTYIGGDEWLRRPGSVGKPWRSVIRILDPEGQELPAGEVGEIFMGFEERGKPTYRYIGAPPAKSTLDGLVSVGDMGWVDADGYLYLADRRVDLILTGGANVYPAEVESALLEHPGVSDAVVVGVVDPDWGQRVHAVVQPREAAALDVAELDRYCRERLVPYKVPKSYELVAEFPRDEAGKIRRSAIAAERSSHR